MKILLLGEASFVHSTLRKGFEARLWLRTADHHWLIPATICIGGVVALLCNVLTTLPDNGAVLPLNAITPLIGAPMIIYVILRKP